MKEKKHSNEMTAKYIVEHYGHGVSDDKLREIAKHYNFKPNLFIKNYKSWSGLMKIFGK